MEQHSLYSQNIFEESGIDTMDILTNSKGLIEYLQSQFNEVIGFFYFVTIFTHGKLKESNIWNVAFPHWYVKFGELTWSQEIGICGNEFVLSLLFCLLIHTSLFNI